MTTCPPTEALRRLDHDDLARLDRHIEGCPGCQGRLEQLARLDPSEPIAPASRLHHRPPEIPGFRLGHELGRGGSGVVFEASQLPIGRPVALKIVAGGPALGPAERDRWLREAKAIGRHRHPNILRLHDACEHAGWLFLVLDLALVAPGSPPP